MKYKIFFTKNGFITIRHIAIVFLVLLASYSHSFAGAGPTSIGNIAIGMTKAEYISAIEITPVDCNTYKGSDGKLQRSELKYLSPEKKTLCKTYDFDKTGSIENIQLNGLSYEVVEAKGEASKPVKTIGWDSKAIFFKNRMISLEITYPEVGLETLEAKYGKPEIVDNRKTELCQNRMGNEFQNRVGNLDAVWVTGEVKTILRAYTLPPYKTCSDGSMIPYYILEEPNQIKIIEDALQKYQKEISKKEAQNSPF